MAQVFGVVLYFLGNVSSIDPSSWIIPLAAFMIFVFLESLYLRLIRVSKGRVVRLSLIIVFVSIPILLTGFLFFCLS